jgi:hypothetical protein
VILLTLPPSFAGELGAVVAHHHPGLAALDHQPIQFPSARERGVSHQSQALARAIINHGQDAEAAVIRELIRHEVERPAIVGGHRHRHRRPVPRARLRPPRRRTLFPVEPEQLLIGRRMDHCDGTGRWQFRERGGRSHSAGRGAGGGGDGGPGRPAGCPGRHAAADFAVPRAGRAARRRRSLTGLVLKTGHQNTCPDWLAECGTELLHSHRVAPFF